MNTRTFGAGPIVSTYQNRLLCDFDEYREFLSYMMGRKLWLWELPAARRQVSGVLPTRLPMLKYIPPLPEKTDSGNGGRYIKACAKIISNQLALSPCRQPVPQLPTLLEIING